MTRRSVRSVAFVVLTLLVWAALGAQAVTVHRAGDAVAVRAPGFTFIKGEPLERLRDGRSIRVDLALAVLPRADAPAVARIRQTYVLSYDLWEERFAATLVGPPSKSIAYLTSTGAEAWCLEQLTVPAASLGALGRDEPFWVRLEYRIQDEAASAGDGGGYTLQTLIDAMSRRQKADEWAHTLEAGPFRLNP